MSDAVRRIRAAVDIPIQLGGGLRMEEHLTAAFDHGIDHVVLGTAALRDPALVACAVARWGDRVAVALDARDGRLADEGWLEQSDALARDVAVRLEDVGVERFIFTDIGRDGTLAGPNLDALSALVGELKASVIASGGIGVVSDVARVAATGASGVIIGRALYDGRVDLAQAIATAKTAEVVR